jgi:hypothetical protein
MAKGGWPVFAFKTILVVYAKQFAGTFLRESNVYMMVTTNNQTSTSFTLCGGVFPHRDGGRLKYLFRAMNALYLPTPPNADKSLGNLVKVDIGEDEYQIMRRTSKKKVTKKRPQKQQDPAAAAVMNKQHLESRVATKE